MRTEVGHEREVQCVRLEHDLLTLSALIELQGVLLGIGLSPHIHLIEQERTDKRLSINFIPVIDNPSNPNQN